MQLSRKADYALRAVAYAAQLKKNELASIGRIAKARGIPREFLAKILKELTRAGILVSFQGVTGGYHLDFLCPVLVTLIVDHAGADNPGADYSLQRRCHGTSGLAAANDKDPAASEAVFIPVDANYPVNRVVFDRGLHDVLRQDPIDAGGNDVQGLPAQVGGGDEFPVFDYHGIGWIIAQ